MTDTFTLTAAEKSSPLWFKLKSYLEQRLERARGRNDGPLSTEDTALVRGEIKALKGLLALGKELPPIETASEPGPQ
jgi:hypothetical protein